MVGDRGQISRITVRARLDNGLIKYDIIDGFHRTLGAVKKGFSEIKAVVIYGCNDEELYDLRILAVNSVKSIQFSRLIQWIQLSFENSPFANLGINVSQAFAIASNDSEKSSVAKLSPEKTRELKEWVKEKAEIWQRPIASIYQDLRIANISDPTLANEVRSVSGGSSGSRYTTREKLRRVSERFPGQENWVLQRAIIHFANEHQLQTKQIDAIISYFEKHSSLDISDEEQLKAIIKKEYPHMFLLRKGSVTTQTDKIFSGKESTADESNSPGSDGINQQLEELLNADMPKKIRDYLCRWTRDPQHHLSKEEAYILQTFLYNPSVNVFQRIKERGIKISQNDIESLILSAIRKKILFDSGHDVDAASKEVE